MRKRSIFGWIELIIGIILIFLGVFAISHTDAALTWMVFFYGLTAVVTGITDIILYVKTEQYTGFAPAVSLIAGILSVMAGVMLLVYPGAGKWVVVLLLPIWFIAHCISRLSHLHIIRIAVGNIYYYVDLILNSIGLVLGCMMIIWPMISFFAVGFLIGAYLILAGIDSIVMAISRIGSK
ncbi:DUF308 domain-containing protein [Blautia schinkii]|nr:DUF308 domain-containing protein [Blautia schinkii]